MGSPELLQENKQRQMGSYDWTLGHSGSKNGLMTTDEDKPEVGAKVVLVSVPPGLLNGLPEEDQRAITAIVGRPVSLAGYDEDGRAELEFAGLRRGQHHTIWVDPKFIRAYR